MCMLIRLLAGFRELQKPTQIYFFISKNKYQNFYKGMKEFCDSVVTEYTLHQAEVHLQD